MSKDRSGRSFTSHTSFREITSLPENIELARLQSVSDLVKKVDITFQGVLEIAVFAYSMRRCRSYSSIFHLSSQGGRFLLFRATIPEFCSSKFCRVLPSPEAKFCADERGSVKFLPFVGIRSFDTVLSQVCGTSLDQNWSKQMGSS